MLKIKDVVAATGGSIVSGDGMGEITGVSTDSRTIMPGELFFALKGSRFDGHSFVIEVAKKGAIGAVVNEWSVVSGQWLGFPSPGFNLISVNDALQALGKLANFWRQIHPVPLIAVGGSCGKTTTKEMIASILQVSRVVLKTEGNLNNLIGLPLTLFGLNNVHRAVVVELGISKPGEMKRLVDICRPDVAVLTNIGEAHLSSLGGIEGVASAKGELFQGLTDQGVAVVNLDDPWIVKIAEGIKIRKVTYSLRKRADVFMKGYSQEGLDRLRATFVVGGEISTITFKGFGVHNLQNAAASISACLPLGVDRGDMKEGLSRFQPLDGRMKTTGLGGVTLIDDTYNANPTSTEASLKTLTSISGRRIAVLGDMLELGEVSLGAHRRIGGLCHSLGIDILFLIGDFKSDVAQGAIEAGMGEECIHLCNSRDEVTTLLAGTLKEGDVVLVKGSRAMGMEEIVEKLVINKGLVRKE
ncbi:MAG: UDP-N-acetylmuramoyl-tripeptide--D-alanyl-D-alanine ligase [Deltaproteobacteria bacterium]|nr:UDP-N-acetylmuramoyl-tripeptide--D-alanyl-D-alanine ligase [Deltaproteobacteria bacterium]